jgi:polar amino acid transport system ATP-binding protein
VINVKNLYKEFHRGNNVLRILSGINVDIKKGERVAIIGPSGSGKSTFLRCINGLEIPTSGEIFFEEKNITDSKCNMDEVRKHIGMVFQHFNLFPHLTILQNITLAPVYLKLFSKKDAESCALALLEKVGLRDKAEDYPAMLSGGQKQRVAIIRALIMNPKLMLFDEPTSALDPEMIKEVTKVMADIANGGMTMIVVTHEMSFVKEIASRVLFMDNGKIIADETPEELFGNCQNVRVRKFVDKLL